MKYRENPYLRNLSEKEVYTYGKRILDEMIPHFLKGGQCLPEEKVKELMIAWTDFLEEANYRGLDLKKLNKQRKTGLVLPSK